MNKTEREVLRNVVARLQGEKASPEVQAHLEAIRPFLDSWVIGPLELLGKDERRRYDLDLARELSSTGS